VLARPAIFVKSKTEFLGPLLAASMIPVGEYLLRTPCYDSQRGARSFLRHSTFEVRHSIDT
jgi:hypothetical protein